MNLAIHKHTMRVLAVLGVVGLAVVATTTASSAIDPGVDATVRINQIQVVGSHNSYHLRASQAEYEVRQAIAPAFNIGLDYEHPALGVQFDAQRVRQIELDIAADPAGGLYSTPLIREAAGEGPLPPADKAIMDAPGIKVIHAQDVDYRSNCLTLKICLQNVKTWSDAHPDHAPIAILLELKDDAIPVVPSPPAVMPIPWTSANMGTIDSDIASVFAPTDLVTPDDVKGGYATVNAGAMAGNWPTLGDARGKVMFLMDNGGTKRTEYLAIHPGLAGAPIFTNSTPGQADAAFIKVNTPTGDNLASIQQLVADGYMVRTRADADTLEARSGDTAPRTAAFASGAQWVSTDYPGAGSAALLGSTYSVELPGGVTARCNPVNAPETCIDSVLDTVPVTPLPPGALGTAWITGGGGPIPETPNTPESPQTPARQPKQPDATTTPLSPVAKSVPAVPRYTG